LKKRAAFLPFTQSVLEFAKAALQQHATFADVKFTMPDGSKPGKTSFWIQLKVPLQNPFHGSEMLEW
jgi:hypothetical protein